MSKLKGRTIFITGSSRGIGREIALRCAEDGANIVITGKSADPHPTLPGTIYTVAEEVEQQGGNALALPLDVRDVDAIQKTVDKALERFGGIDILINNASALSLTNTLEMTPKRFDLMFAVNVRATFFSSKACIPHLKNSANPHILNLAPPLNMQAKWFKDHLAYTMSKYGMSMCTLGMAEELKEDGIAVNSLWPKTTIATSAVAVNFPPEILQASRKPRVTADAAYCIITSPSDSLTGQFFIDEDILKQHGVHDFSKYLINPSAVKLYTDLFLEE